MKTSAILSAAALLCIACVRLDPGPFGPHTGGNLSGDPDRDSTVAATRKPSVYFTAIEIDDGYDWRRDTACGINDCRLVLYKDFEPVLTIPAGRANEVGTDPDMHRIIDGHLYTEYSTSGKSVVKKDGQVLYRADRTENLRGLAVVGSVVYTLSQKSYGGGFTLRKDGSEVFSRTEGTILGQLHVDEGHVCFAYILKRDFSGALYYLVEDGVEKRLTTNSLDLRILDAVQKEGKIKMFSQVYLGTNGTFIDNGKETRISDRLHFLIEGGLTEIDGWICATGRLRYELSDHSEAFLWNGALRTVDTEDQVFFLGNKSDSPYIRYGSDGSFAVIGLENQVRAEDFPDRYWFFNGNCAAVCDGAFYAVLTPRKRDGYPMVVTEGRKREVKIDGYLTGISVSPPRK